jgi:hypothetical protein
MGYSSKLLLQWDIPLSKTMNSLTSLDIFISQRRYQAHHAHGILRPKLYTEGLVLVILRQLL